MIRLKAVQNGEIGSNHWHTLCSRQIHPDLYRQLAIEGAGHGARSLLRQWSCAGDARCLEASLARWIEQAYRGPLTSEERDAFTAIVTFDAEPEPALREVLQLIFQSPRFLYVIERGIPRAAEDDARDLTTWELATRLSYFLWAEPPDGLLRDAAASGELADPATLRAHASRLVQHPKAARTVGHALLQWAAPELTSVAKAASVYPEFDAALRVSLIEQFERFAAMALADDMSLDALLTTRRTPVDANLAALLGVPSVFDWTIAELDGPRFGILTLPGVLAAHARADDSSPVARGLFIRQNLLCQVIPPPPPGVATLPPTSSNGAGFRERFEEHTSNPTCAGCHSLMDPLGFPFEIYDGIGRLRDDFASIRTAGQLDGIEAPISYADLRGLVDGLRDAPEVSRCWAQQWIQRALGPTAAGDTVLVDAFAARVAADAPLADLIVELVTAPEFRRVYRTP